MNLIDIAGEHKLGDSLMGVSTSFYHPNGSDSEGIAFELGGFVYFILEDSNDGYRSGHAPILRAKGNLYEFVKDLTYVREFVRPRHLTKYAEYGSEHDADILQLLGSDGHIWITVGTDNIDDYYPSFICNFQPKKA